MFFYATRRPEISPDVKLVSSKPIFFCFKFDHIDKA